MPHTSALKRKTSLFIEHPLWASLGAIVGVIGIVVSIIQLMAGSGYTPAALEAAIVTLGAPEEIDATLVAHGTPTTLTESPVDITLKNNGDKPALITEVNAETLFFSDLEDCANSRALPEPLSGSYLIKLPTTTSADQHDPDTTSTSMRFEVKPGAIDRLKLTVGPEEQAATAAVMAVHLTLTHDGSETLDVGNVLIASTRSGRDAAGDPAMDPECAARNLKVLDELYAIQGQRAPDLERMRMDYQRLAG